MSKNCAVFLVGQTNCLTYTSVLSSIRSHREMVVLTKLWMMSVFVNSKKKISGKIPGGVCVIMCELKLQNDGDNITTHDRNTTVLFFFFFLIFSTLKLFTFLDGNHFRTQLNLIQNINILLTPLMKTINQRKRKLTIYQSLKPGKRTQLVSQSVKLEPKSPGPSLTSLGC